MSETKQNRYNTQQNMVRPDDRQLPSVRRMTPEETAALTSMTQGQVQSAQSIQLPEFDGAHTGHVRHVDDPVTNARATIEYGHVIGGWAAVALSAILFYGFIHGSVDREDFVPAEAMIIGVCMLISLVINRAQGLHHSATGIAHGELKTRERMYDRMAEVEEHRIDADTEVRLAEIQMRRELGQEFVKRLGGGEQQ